MMARNLRYRARYAIAALINRLPGQCWADLVMWVMDSAESKLPWAPSASCREDMQRAGSCYCGKFRLPRLLDRNGAVWSPDGRGTYTFSGFLNGWSRDAIDIVWGPLAEIDDAEVSP